MLIMVENTCIFEPIHFKITNHYHLRQKEERKRVPLMMSIFCHTKCLKANWFKSIRRIQWWFWYADTVYIHFLFFRMEKKQQNIILICCLENPWHFRKLSNITWIKWQSIAATNWKWIEDEIFRIQNVLIICVPFDSSAEGNSLNFYIFLMISLPFMPF